MNALVPEQKQLAAPSWVPLHSSLIRLPAKKRKRLEVAFLNYKIPRSLDPYNFNVTRVLGDHLFFVDQDEARKFLNCKMPYNLTKKIASFEADEKRNRWSLFYHPFSNMTRNGTMEELQRSSNKNIQEALDAMYRLEKLGPRMPEILATAKTYEVHDNWNEMFRRGEAPFNAESFDKNKFGIMLIWEIVHSDDRWDLLLSAISMTFKAAHELGYSFEDLSTQLQTEGIPRTGARLSDNHLHLRLSYSFYNKLLQNPAEIIEADKEVLVRTKTDHLKHATGKELWKIANVGPRSFLIALKQFDKVKAFELVDEETKIAKDPTLPPQIYIRKKIEDDK